MSDAPILRDTERTTGRSALQNNIQAAMALAGAVRSTLGPRGLDKLLIDDDGRTLVTNDGVTVLESAKVEWTLDYRRISDKCHSDSLFASRNFSLGEKTPQAPFFACVKEGQGFIEY